MRRNLVVMIEFLITYDDLLVIIVRICHLLVVVMFLYVYQWISIYLMLISVNCRY